MRITIVLGAFLPVPPIMGGAVEKAWFALGQEFARRGHEVVQISRAVPSLPRTETIASVRHLRLPGFDTPRSLVWLKFLDLLYSMRVWRNLPEADVIVTNTFWLPMLLRNKTRGAVYVHVARFPKGQMRFYRRAARLQTVSCAVGRAIIAEAPRLADKVSVIPYPRPGGGDETMPPTIDARAKILLYVGRIHPEKGLDLLLDALAEMEQAARADWRLIVVGPAETKLGGGGVEYLRRLQKFAADQQLDVEWRGAIFDAAELTAAYRSARLFVYPSLAETGETFGLAPLEAMANGCAVVVSDLNCFHDFISQDKTGFLFDHRAEAPVAALCEKLTALAKDENLDQLARVADAGWRKSLEFSLPEVAAKYLADFESILRPT